MSKSQNHAQISLAWAPRRFPKVSGTFRAVQSHEQIVALARQKLKAPAILAFEAKNFGENLNSFIWIQEVGEDAVDGIISHKRLRVLRLPLRGPFVLPPTFAYSLLRDLGLSTQVLALLLHGCNHQAPHGAPTQAPRSRFLEAFDQVCDHLGQSVHGQGSFFRGRRQSTLLGIPFHE